MKKSVILLLLFSFSFFIGCGLDSVRLKADSELEWPVFTEFVDPGIVKPRDFSVVVTGNVDTNILGEYPIIYQVFDEEGVLAKELTRTVKVIDNVPPTFSIRENMKFFIGASEDDDMTKDQTDNYYPQVNLDVYSNIETVNPDHLPGTYEITFTLRDPSRNKTSITREIEFIYSISDLIYNMKLDEHPEIVSRDVYNGGEAGIVFKVKLSNGDSLNAYSENNHIHYAHQISSDYTYSSIGIEWDYGTSDTCTIWVYLGEQLQEGFVFSRGTSFNFDVMERSTSPLSLVLEEVENNLNVPQEEMETLLNQNAVAAMEALTEIFEAAFGLACYE
jgi:hypothetical protein